MSYCTLITRWGFLGNHVNNTYAFSNDADTREHSSSSSNNCQLPVISDTFGCRSPFFSNHANPAPAQGYTSVQEDISYRPTQQSFVYEVEDLIREALKREIRWGRSAASFRSDEP